MNVCGYVRVSSDGQTENYSIPQQQEPELSFEDAKKILKNAKKILKNARKNLKDARKNFADTFTVEQQRAILHSLIKKNRVAWRRDTDILAV